MIIHDLRISNKSELIINTKSWVQKGAWHVLRQGTCHWNTSLLPFCSSRTHGYVGCRKNWACVTAGLYMSLLSTAWVHPSHNSIIFQSLNLEFPNRISLIFIDIVHIQVMNSEFHPISVLFQSWLIAKGPTRPSQHSHLRARFPVTWQNEISMVRSSRMQLEAWKQSYQQNSELIIIYPIIIYPIMVYNDTQLS